MNRNRLVLLVIALLACTALAGFWLRPGESSDWQGVVLDDPPLLGDIALTAYGGDTVVLADLEADYLLLFFGYTRCPDVCPLTMALLAEAYRDLGEPEDVQVVLVTVDPQNDSAEIVQAYAEVFHEDFMGLSGSQQDVAAAALRFYVGFRDVGNGLLAHSDPVALLDSDRRMRVLYTQDTVGQLEGDLGRLLSERPW